MRVITIYIFLKKPSLCFLSVCECLLINFRKMRIWLELK